MADKLIVSGARGPGLTELARRTGNFGVEPTDSDEQALGKFADAAIQQNPGFKGDVGNTGPANSTYPTLALLKAAPVSNRTYNFAPPSGSEDGIFAGPYIYQEGNFAGADYADDLAKGFIVKLDAKALSQGALTLQSSDGITSILDASVAVRRRVQAKVREVATIQDFMVVAAGPDYQTIGFQNAINWSAANKRLVQDKLGADFTTGPLVWKAFALIQSPSQRGTRIFPRAMTSAEAADPVLSGGHLNLDRGPVIETYMEGLQFIGNPQGTRAPGWGARMTARRKADPNEYPNGGWWYSEGRRSTWSGYTEGGMWLEAGSYGTGDAPNDYLNYDFLRPHQFLDFVQCTFDPGGAANAPGLLGTGQNAQIYLRSCPSSGDGTRPCFVFSPCAFDGDGVIRGGFNRSTAFIPASQGGGFITIHNCFPQGGSWGIMMAKTDSPKIHAYLENCLAGGMLLQDMRAQISNSIFNNAGSGAGQALIYLNNASIYGCNNRGGTNGYQIDAVGDSYAAPGIFTDPGNTRGLTRGTSPAGDGGLTVGRCADVNVNTSTVPIVAISAATGRGETLTIRAANGFLSFSEGTGGNLRIPGGKVNLRAGDTITFRREDGNLFWVIGLGIAPLTFSGMPTAGYYDASERVRNIQTPPAGAYPSDYQRLTSGTGHVAGTDWRALQVTGV